MAKRPLPELLHALLLAEWSGGLELRQRGIERHMIEPRPVFKAYAAWCRFLIHPRLHAKLALQELSPGVKSPK